ncbi:anoctamin-like protein Os01g0706700 [Magnolia sinica]|uniref:anoctamin-like protein Os01g0706700 n=1 Tax=Magnolia sinica TaxID=86752 RepID=UPI0026582F77|nr:anoctamin-like protein Os01g0706700 [Magnolia sinica]
MKPSYSASTGEELEDGLFDDFLELALQFGMIMMFACAFPLDFAFAVLNNITEIRTDALKLLVMLRRPIPRAAATIGAWLNIFQLSLYLGQVNRIIACRSGTLCRNVYAEGYFAAWYDWEFGIG